MLLAVIGQRVPTVRSTARLTGFSLRWTYDQLLALRSVGLVTWDEAKQGTLRPLVRVAATDPAYDPRHGDHTDTATAARAARAQASRGQG